MNRAKSLALDSIARHTARLREELRIIDELTQCRRVGWIFFYEARAIGKTGPVVVTHQGHVHLLGGGRHAEDVLRAFEKSLPRGGFPDKGVSAT